MSAGFNIKLPPPDEFGRIPAVPPPPGVKSNFDNPEWIGDRVIITTAICFALSTVFVGLRLYTRVFISHAAGLEDALIAVSWVLCVAAGVMGILTVLIGGMGYHMWDVQLKTFIPTFLQLNLASSSVSVIANLLTKLSVIQLLVRISSHLRGLRYSYRVLMGFVIVYNLAMFFILIFSCKPIKASWYPFISPKKCIAPEDIFRPFAVIDAVFSIILVLAPLPLVKVMRNRISSQQRIALGLIIGFGTITCISPIIRAYETYQPVTDLTYATTDLLVWWAIELHVSIACACATCLKPFFRRHFPSLKGLGGSYFGGSNSNTRYPAGSTNLSKRGQSHSHSHTGRRGNGSMELGAYSARSGRKGMGFDTMVMASGNGSGSDGFASEDAMAVGGRPSQGSDRSERQLVKDIRGTGGSGWTNDTERSDSRVATHHQRGSQRSESGIMVDRTFDMQVERRV